MIDQVMRKVRTVSIRRVAPYVIIVVLIAFSFLLIQWYMTMISPGGFMKTENIAIEDYEFSRALNIIVLNTGTAVLTIVEAKVNGTTVDIADVTLDFGEPRTITIFYDWIPKTTYDIKLITATGKEFNYTATAP